MKNLPSFKVLSLMISTKYIHFMHQFTRTFLFFNQSTLIIKTTIIEIVLEIFENLRSQFYNIKQISY